MVSDFPQISPISLSPPITIVKLGLSECFQGLRTLPPITTAQVAVFFEI